MGFRGALEYVYEVVTITSMSDDAEAGIGAFLDDSTPAWTGRTGK